MKIPKFGFFGLVLGGLLLLGAEARAVEVRYSTVGTFGATNTSAITNSNITITFVGAGIPPAPPESVDVPPASQASFGQFVVTAPPNATTDVSFTSSFTLEIFQEAPTIGGITFVGSLSGMLRVNNSRAVVQFDQPLTQSIGLVVYQIVSADDDIPGRINLAPPTTNQGRTTIQGRINLIPEPSAMVLVGMGAVAPLAMMLRRRGKVRAAA